MSFATFARRIRRFMCQLALAAMLTVMGANVGEAEMLRTGLLWNKTGLPAVFPLQVKTAKGQSYVMTLVEPQTRTPALAAFIKGGEFFKVLVPPGLYEVQFAPRDAEREAAGLDDADPAIYFALEQPLRFAVLDSGTKGGHLIDLTDGRSAIAIKDQFICQRVAISRFPRLHEPFDNEDSFATQLTEEGEIMRFPHRFSSDRLSAGVDSPVIPTDFAPYFSDPRYEIRQTPC